MSQPNFNCMVIRDTLKICVYPEKAVISRSIFVILSMIYLINNH